MKILHNVVSGMIVLLGLIHCAFTLANYEEFTMDAFWFLGSGIAIVLAGFLNFAFIRDGGRDTVIRGMALLTNATFLALFALATVLLRQPQVLIGLALFGFATLSVLLPNSND